MALTSDILTTRYGSQINHQPIEYPVGKGSAGQTLYRGSIAALSGGTTVTAGYLKNIATPAATDIVVGVITGYGPSCGLADSGPGVIAPNTSNGVVTANVATGTFYMLGGTGADSLSVTNVGTSVYLVNENTVGATSGSASRPVAGLLVQVPATDASIPTGMVAVQLGTPGTPWGGV
jgi:Ca2+-binding RTX toxin-like protein